MSVGEILEMNKGIEGSTIRTGQTLLIPGNKLSLRDMSIISGLAPGQKVREYPLRKGEKVADVAAARGISMDEIKELNGKRWKKLKVIKLPADKYTVREQEMMTGVLGVPTEFFKTASAPANALFLGGVAVLGLAIGIFFYKKEGDS